MRRGGICAMTLAALALSGCLANREPTYEGTVAIQPNLTGAMYRVSLEILGAEVPDPRQDPTFSSTYKGAAIRAGAKFTHPTSFEWIAWANNETLSVRDSYGQYFFAGLNGTLQRAGIVPQGVVFTSQSPDGLRFVREGDKLDETGYGSYSKIEIVDNQSGKVQELQDTAGRYPRYFDRDYDPVSHLRISSSLFGGFAWSPDGEKIAFSCLKGGKGAQHMLCLFKLERLA